VLKLSVLFYLVLFLIVCVASAVLWSAGRQTGAIENVEDFITELGVFGECEPIEGGPADDTAPTTTTLPEEVDQLPIDPTEDAVGPLGAEVERDDDGCVIGEEEFVGSFRFEGDQLFQAFVLGGLVLVLAGAAGSVVLAVLFNLISDLTGGVRVTVLEEPTAGDGAQPRDRTGSPPPRTGG
jgi:hypothetical protein